MLGPFKLLSRKIKSEWKLASQLSRRKKQPPTKSTYMLKVQLPITPEGHAEVVEALRMGNVFFIKFIAIPFPFEKNRSFVKK